LILGYDAVTVTVNTGNFLVFLPKTNFKEYLPENYTGDIGIISGKNLTGLTFSNGTTENQYFKITEFSGTLPSTSIDFSDILDGISITIAKINALKTDEESIGKISEVFWKNFMEGPSILNTNLLLTTAKKLFLETLPEQGDAQKYYTIEVKENVELDFENKDGTFTNGIPNFELTGIFGETNPQTTLTKTFFLPLSDINEAPESVHATDSNALGLQEERTINLENIGITTNTDQDENDTHLTLTIKGISLDENKTSTEISDWSSNDIISSEEYEFKIQESGTQIYIKNLGATGGKTLYFLLCDDDATTPLCSVSSITGTFSEALRCEPFTLEEATGKYQFPENTDSTNPNATVISGTEISEYLYLAQNSSGSLQCSDSSIQKQVKCFNGKYVYTDNTAIVGDIYSSCQNQCEPFNSTTSPITWINHGETENFFAAKNATGTACTTPDKTYQCKNGTWYAQETGQETFTIPTDNTSILRSCNVQCVDSDGEKANHNSTKTLYKKHSTSCTVPSNEEKEEIICNQGTWENNTSKFFPENSPENSPEWKDENNDIWLETPQCSIDDSCTLIWKNRDGTSNSLPLENGKTLTSLVFPSDAKYLYASTNNCSDSLVSLSHVVCDTRVIKYGKITTDRVERTAPFYSYCNQKCTISGIEKEYDEGDTEILYKWIGGRCIQKNIECKQNGLWKKSGDIEEKNTSVVGYHNDPTCNGQRGENTEDIDPAIDIAMIVEHADNSAGSDDEEENYLFSNSPIVQVDSALDNMTITARDPDFYDKKRAGSRGDTPLFSSPFSTSKTVGDDVRVTLKVRGEYSDPNTLYQENEPESKIAIRWKVSGKDKYGDAISLFPVFHFESENSLEQGCGEGINKKMICLHHFNTPDTTVNDGTHQYSIVSITNNDGGTGFQGKIDSLSTDFDIVDRVKDFNDSEYGDNSDGYATLNAFLSDPVLGVTYPEFQVIYEHPLYTADEINTGKGNKIPLSYQFIIDNVTNTNAALSDNRFKVTSSGSYGGSEQKIETTIEKGTLLPVFNYVIFGE